MGKRLTYNSDGSALWSALDSFATGNQTAISSANDLILNGDQSQAGQYLELITSANKFSGIIIKLSSAAKIAKLFLSFFWATRSGAATSTLFVIPSP